MLTHTAVSLCKLWIGGPFIIHNYTLNEKPEASAAAWCGASKFRWLSRYGHNIDIKGQ